MLHYILKKGGTPLTIELVFDSPKHTKNVRSLQPFKFVKTEYWVMSGMTLVGNIGGTLGMFIGFSFIGFSQWIMDLVIGLSQWIMDSINRKVNPSNTTHPSFQP